MTTSPELLEDRNFLPGLAAVAFFVVIGVTMVAASYEPAVGFEAGAHITGSIGRALVNISGGEATIPGAEFLSVFFTISLVLVAALIAAVMLARRERESVLERKRGGED
ncbi:MAG: proton-conducting membrane transporter [Halodesulfurarchaeum sp.]